MFQSRLTTIRVPTIPVGPPSGTDPPKPATIIERAGANLIVKVRNNSFGAYVLLALDNETLMRGGSNADTFKLPAGSEGEFVLAAGQSLYVSTPSPAVDNEISAHIYEAVPIEEERGV